MTLTTTERDALRRMLETRTRTIATIETGRALILTIAPDGDDIEIRTDLPPGMEEDEAADLLVQGVAAGVAALIGQDDILGRLAAIDVIRVYLGRLRQQIEEEGA